MKNGKELYDVPDHILVLLMLGSVRVKGTFRGERLACRLSIPYPYGELDVHIEHPHSNHAHAYYVFHDGRSGMWSTGSPLAGHADTVEDLIDIIYKLQE